MGCASGSDSAGELLDLTSADAKDDLPGLCTGTWPCQEKGFSKSRALI